MARTKQRRTYLPYSFPAVARRLLIYRPRKGRPTFDRLGVIKSSVGAKDLLRNVKHVKLR